ncbi:MAG: serine dehydrogenasease [Candidatus Schekmanbacteria bacterium]|nr:serine dehydrogenasease [Candidatus Schekmanbacteria bacterium]
MRPLDGYIKNQLDKHLEKIEVNLKADGIAIVSPILYKLDNNVRDTLELIENKKKTLVVIHDTPGGVAEVVERIVSAIRHFYEEVFFIIPDRAMSAGTIFALSGDRILMDYFSCLGPIDPQIEKDGRLVPALSYLNQFERLKEKATMGELTSAEYALLSKMDLGELYQFEQARELSKELLIQWLSKYKFKNWNETQTNKIKVTDDFKKKRADEIARKLNDSNRWHSHSRGIAMQTLRDEVGLQIEDYTEIEGLGPTVKEYFELLQDYMTREKLVSFVHSKRGVFSI